MLVNFVKSFAFNQHFCIPEQQATISKEIYNRIPLHSFGNYKWLNYEPLNIMKSRFQFFIFLFFWSTYRSMLLYRFAYNGAH